MQEPKTLTRWLDRARDNAGAYRIALFVVLALLVALNFAVRPPEAEFAAEALPAFWAVYALVAAIVMVFVLKKIVYPLLARPEEEDTNDRR
jgi:TRAP-type mannitol/chloroaromatic compound transport system permease small subunit